MGGRARGEIRSAAEATTRSGKLIYIGQYPIGPLRYLRFNYTTGDAAGQNMTGKATLAACEWIRENHPDQPRFLLSGNMDTDKKHSRINMLLTRGKRVVAEATIKDELLRSLMGVDAATLFWARQISSAGSFLVGCGQQRRPRRQRADGTVHRHRPGRGERGRVARRHRVHATAGHRGLLLVHHPARADRGDVRRRHRAADPARVPGDARLLRRRQGAKFAEICAAVVLAGETSLSSAVIHGDWVSSHDQLGRNRP